MIDFSGYRSQHGNLMVGRCAASAAVVTFVRHTITYILCNVYLRTDHSPFEIRLAHTRARMTLTLSFDDNTTHNTFRAPQANIECETKCEQTNIFGSVKSHFGIIIVRLWLLGYEVIMVLSFSLHIRSITSTALSLAHTDTRAHTRTLSLDRGIQSLRTMNDESNAF